MSPQGNRKVLQPDLLYWWIRALHRADGSMVIWLPCLLPPAGGMLFGNYDHVWQMLHKTRSMKLFCCVSVVRSEYMYCQLVVILSLICLLEYARSSFSMCSCCYSGLLQKFSGNKVLVMELCAGGSLHDVLSEPKNVFGLEETEYLRVQCHVG